jgi:hypothetical protein
MLLVKVILVPADPDASSMAGSLQRHVQVDEVIRGIQALPHVRHEGMVLGRRPGVIAKSP